MEHMTKKHPLFSVIILHYKCERYLKEAIDSVLKQQYPAIELLIADDATPDFDPLVWHNYISSQAPGFLQRLEVFTRIQNIGTVQNLNDALSKATGEWVVCFAGDDALYDGKVLNRFAQEISVLPEDGLCVAAQCQMMDSHMREKLMDFIPSERAIQLNKEGSKAQFCTLMTTPFYGVGSSAFRLRDFDAYGYFDNRYRLVEDWSYFLAQTRKGRRTVYCDFPALKHRTGGISHAEAGPPSPVFWNDMLTIKEQEILPFLHWEKDVRQQQKILTEYVADLRAYRAVYGPRPGISKWRLLVANPQLFGHKLLWRFLSK